MPHNVMYKMAGDALKKVNTAHNELLTKLNGQTDTFGIAQRMFPTGLTSLMELNQRLDSYNHGVEEYEVLCRRMVTGWSNLFNKIAIAVEKGRR